MQYLKSYQKKKKIKKNLHLLPQFFIFIFYIEKQIKTEKQQKHAYGEKK
jgi:hypothetical protein